MTDANITPLVFGFVRWAASNAVTKVFLLSLDRRTDEPGTIEYPLNRKAKTLLPSIVIVIGLNLRRILVSLSWLLTYSKRDISVANCLSKSPSIIVVTLLFKRRHCLYPNILTGKASFFKAASPRDLGFISLFVRTVSSATAKAFRTVKALCLDPRRYSGFCVHVWFSDCTQS